MKQIIKILFSSKTTFVLLVILGVAMSVATFIEDKYDTVSAKHMVYNAKWFELLFLLLIVNLIGHIKTYNLMSWKKIGGLVFHLAFVVMIIGAGVTRYFGFEGTMHIRKGEASNVIYSSEPYLLVSYTEKGKNFDYDFPMSYGALNENSFNVSIPSEEKGEIEINYNSYIKNAVEKVEENVPGGKDILELSTATENGQQGINIVDGEEVGIGKIAVAYNNLTSKEAIIISDKDSSITIKAPFDMVQSDMNETEKITIKKDSTVVFKLNYIYSANGTMFMCTKHYKDAKKIVVSGFEEEKGVDAIIVNVTINGKKQQANVFGGNGYIANYQDFSMEGTTIKFAYGDKPIELPFSLYLREFILDRYPGSESPSSFASEVTLIDKNNNVNEERRIFMNNVLDYKKYRFFQSSYDADEKGTILSVNHDFWGTWISYVGYILLTIGFIITLFNKNSRFLSLRRNITEVRSNRKSLTLTIALLLGLSISSFAQMPAKLDPQKPVSAEHADKFAHLITQSVEGRFEPAHSLAYDVMHKITRKDNFDLDGKGSMNAMQVFLDIIAEPEFWQAQKIIYVREKSVKELIGIDTKNAAFIDFFDAESKYKLQTYVQEAFRKKQSEQNAFDKEVIKVDERVNVFMMVIKASILKIFPEPGSPNNKWVSWDDPASMTTLTGAISVINEDLKLRTFNYANLFQTYAEALVIGKTTGDFSKADKIVDHISTIQRSTNAELLPSEKAINAEIFYNKSQIFIMLKNFYALISVILLLLAFIDNIRSKKNKIIAITMNICAVLLGIAFLYHTLGMGLRWYITGHAPWSNGYEALILVAWGALIAGFSFAKNSKITLGATTLLAFFVLMTAGHSSYDPQLTNLQPVLKSYWLIIHVATLTISYAFLGLGFILGIMNMFIYIFKTSKNKIRLDLLIAELSYINEMNLIVGLVLATIGTFLGGVWANESWGRYWGWDAKETWALIIVITYTVVLHMRFIPKLKEKYFFNVASILAFSSVIMTFVGVNYYLSKGLHSYGQGDSPIFPIWAWILILSVFLLIIVAGIRDHLSKDKV